MALNVGEQTFALPTNPDYYKYAACVGRGDTVRFYDSNDPTGLHYNSICSDDCILPHKNAILQSPQIKRSIQYSNYDCSSLGPNGESKYAPVGAFGPLTQLYSICSNAMNYTNYYIAPSNDVIIFDCVTEPPLVPDREPIRRVYEEFSSYSRVRLKSILVPTANRDLDDPTFRYMPLSDGLLIDINNSEVTNSVSSFNINNSNHNLVGDIFNGCLRNDTTFEQQNIDYCRTQYKAAFTNIVGNSTPLTLDPNTRDRTPSMGLGCLYSLQIFNNPETNCPSITQLCKSPDLKGTWEFGLANPSKFTVSNLEYNICRNYRDVSTTDFNPFFHSMGQVDNIQISNQLISAFDPRSVDQPTRSFNDGVEPSAFSGYLYRSCDMVDFGLDVNEGNYILNCCSNDFADLNGSTVFTPPETLPPLGRNPGGSFGGSPIFTKIVTTLIGYDYSTTNLPNFNQSVPHYKRCFSRNGYTCDPTYRDITTRECSLPILDHCFLLNNAIAPNVASWNLNTEGSGECAKWFGRVIYGDLGNWTTFIDVVKTRGTLPPFVGTKFLSTYLFDTILPNIPKLFSTKDILDGQGVIQNPLKAAMEPIFFVLYKSYNLALYDGGWLSGECANYKAEDILKYGLLRRWCGCLLNTSIYEDQYPNIASECTPFCNSSDVIQLGQQCQGSTCIIDDVTIQIVNSTTGNISINQFCNACANITSNDTQTVSQKCNCIINNVDFSIISSKVGNISVDQLCNTGRGGSSNASAGGSAQESINQTYGNPLDLIIGDIPTSVILISLTLLIMTIVFYNRPRLRNGLIVALVLSLLMLAVFYYYSFGHKL